MSRAISSLVELAKAEGLSCEFDPYWERVDVWSFDEPMPDSVRKTGEELTELKYFQENATQHDRAAEGFIDSSAGLAIAFARSK